MKPIEHLNYHMAGDGADAKCRWARYYEPIHALSEGLPAPILGIMILIWQLRDADLQKAFPLDTLESRQGFLAWCIYHGRHEYRALAEAGEFWKSLSNKADFGFPLTGTDPGHAISTFMLLVKEARQDLPFDIRHRTGRAEFVHWFLTHGRYELNIASEGFPDWQARYFRSPSETPGLNCLQMIVHEARPDLREAFPLPAMSAQYLDWFETAFIKETVRDRRHLPAPGIAADIEHVTLTRGVNVIGYAYGQLGIGEDARMATRALSEAGLPTALINFQPGSNIPQHDHSAAEFVREDIVYDVNLFCMTALETGRYFAERGARHFASTFNIGYWPWELEEWPEEWLHLFCLIDEAWASSMHTYKAMFSHASVPVKHVPMAVVIPEASGLTRADFRLPAEATLFLFSFDLNSSARRKNPAACVEAFLQAFPADSRHTGRDVGLVIKVHPPTQYNADWDRLLKLRDADARIHIIESTLSKEDLLALYKACDCFISLHRAEGFGRNITEAMLVGTPVITTAYSGNVDYTNHSNSYLVDYQLIPLESGDYPFGQGKFWAEPDIDDAAEKMRAFIADPALCKMRASRARQLIGNQYNFRKIGLRYQCELQK